MLELTEVDYELILKSYSAQDVALEESHKQRLQHYQSYEETLQDYKRLKMESLVADEERQTLYAKFTEKLNIKNSFTQLQNIPNSKMNSLQNEILNMYQMMSHDSDHYVNAVNNAFGKFQNLGTEFDEPAILNNKSVCVKQTEFLVDEIQDREGRYKSMKDSDQEYLYALLIHNVKKSLTGLTEDSDLLKMGLEITICQQQLSILNKNVDFLEQRNREFEVQCAAFG